VEKIKGEKMIFSHEMQEREALIYLSLQINLSQTQQAKLEDKTSPMTSAQRDELEEDNQILHKVILAIAFQYGVDIDFYLVNCNNNFIDFISEETSVIH
tara:strand:+ start:811 stop:1107 length:297 start_codon:yes stop_codon:yes gene_type:complete